MSLGGRSKEKSDNPERARSAALRLLGMREHSRRELMTKLCRRFTSEAATQAVAELADEGLQSDQRTASSLMRSMVAKGYGPAVIRMKFRMLGLGEQDFDEEAPEDWGQAAFSYLERKHAGEPADSAARQKLVQMLCRRGFDLHSAISAVKQLSD